MGEKREGANEKFTLISQLEEQESELGVAIITKRRFEKHFIPSCLGDVGLPGYRGKVRVKVGLP